MDEARVIGHDGQLPWHLPEDLAHFKRLTMGGVVIMGRKTWDSLPPKFRPLPGRTNVVVTRNRALIAVPEGVHRATSIDEALAIAIDTVVEGQRIWIIGGAEIYRLAMPAVDEVHLTRVRGVHEGDAFLAPFEDDFDLVEQRLGEACTFEVYRRKGVRSDTNTNLT
jgi:dihydrofolate reductase